MNSNISYYDMTLRGAVPSTDSDLGRRLKQNRQLLVTDVSERMPDRDTVALHVIGCGNLAAADFILLKNQRADALQQLATDPSYCGEEKTSIFSLLESAGVNVYLALATLRFHHQRGMLPDLIEVVAHTASAQPSLHIKKTHYDCLYWSKEKKHGNCYITPEEAPIEVEAEYRQYTAKYFLHTAYEMFEQEQITQHPRKTSSEKAAAHVKLGETHLRVAHMEDVKIETYLWLLEQAKVHFDSACDIAAKIKVEDHINHAKQIFELQSNERDKALSSTDSADYRIRSFREWQTCFQSAARRDYHIADGVVTRLSLESNPDDEEGVVMVNATYMPAEKEHQARSVSDAATAPCHYRKKKPGSFDKTQAKTATTYTENPSGFKYSETKNKNDANSLLRIIRSFTTGSR